MDEILKDARFAHIPRDPAFKRIPKREKKVKIDKRFQSMFSDKKFNVKFAVDQRGRPVKNSSTENLRRYYALNSSDESDEVSDVEATDRLNSADNISETEVDLFEVKSKKKSKNKQKNHSISKEYITETEVDSFEVKSKKKSKDKQKNHSISKESNEERTVKQKNKDELEYPKKSSKSQRAKYHVLKKTSSEDEEDDDEDEDSESGSESESESDVDEKVHRQIDNDKLDTEFRTVDEKVHARLQDMSVDYARGEGVILSDSSSDEESSEEEEDDFDHGWGELDQNTEQTEESTHRLAVCNVDWDRLRATDLMVLLNSFVPKGGIIHSVSVYPSEYGLQRMKEEDEKGPLELIGNGETKVVNNDVEDKGKKKKMRKKIQRDEEEAEEGDEFQREKLRQYQLNRLRYFYAVVVCDSVATADTLYKECDGMEYESSASHLDLRFIPDDTTFDQEPRETCDQLPNMTKYEPELFITTALQQSKVRLTWDETDPRRLKFNEKLNTGKVDSVDERDLKVYLATSSEEESSEGEVDEKKDSAAKYKALLENINSEESAKKDKNMEMQVTWGINLEDKVKKRMKEGKQEEMTPFQKYMQKRKEKRKAKREEQLKKKQQQKEGGSAGESEGEEAAAGSESDDDVPSDIDMNDAYFKEEFDKEEFAHTKKKDSKNKKNKKKKKGGEESEDEETKRKKAELELLLMDEEDNKKHFSLKDILVEDISKTKKKKNKRKGIEESSEKKDDDFQINVQDQRFSALFTSHLYNIDPADPHYKKTKGMEALRQEKLQRRAVDEEVPVKKHKLDVPERKADTELSLLVKNVKKKAQNLKR